MWEDEKYIRVKNIILLTLSFSHFSISIGYNVAQALIGGTTPAIATVLVDTFGPTAPGFYVSFICVLSLIGLSIVSPRREEGGGRGFESNTLLEVEFTNRGGQSKIV